MKAVPLGFALGLLSAALGCSPEGDGAELDTLAEDGSDTGQAQTEGACTPGLLDCACVQGSCVEGLSCVEGVCEQPSCGNGVHEHFEECDDGNADNSDACTESCRLAACGDGYLQQGEQCDDGNANYGDGCNSLCTGPGLAWLEVYAIEPGGREQVWDLGTDAQGNIFAVGQQLYAADLDADSGLVLAYDRAGAPLWSYRLGELDPAPSVLFTLALGPLGQVYAGGFIYDADNIPTPIILELDGGGALTWELRLEQLAGAGAVDLTLDEDGQLIVVGGFQQGPGFVRAYASDHSELYALELPDQPTNAVAALPGGGLGLLYIDFDNIDTVLARLDGDSFSWAQPLPESIEFRWRELVSDASGKLFAGGGLDSEFSSPEPRIISYDAEGSLRWSSRGLPPNLWGFVNDLAVSPVDGRVYAAGYAEGLRPLVYALSPAGEALWFDYTPSPFGEFTAVSVDDEGAIIFAGVTPPEWEQAASSLILAKYLPG